MAEGPVGKRGENVMISYGIMQGRLTPSKGRGIQFFPFENWEREFYDAAEIGLDEIEWVFDYDRWEENPLSYKQGIKDVKSVIKNTGVQVNSVCWDYFMRRPFYKSANQKEEIRKENINFMNLVIHAASEIGAGLMEIPMVDSSSIKTAEEKAEAVDFLGEICKEAKCSGIKIGVESDLAPGVFTDFLISVNSNNIYANYDTGNSSGLGYDPIEEMKEFSGGWLANVHIKDRIIHGTTVPLGTGSADFASFFSALKELGYKESFILQAARGNDYEEKRLISEQISFVKSYVGRYGINE